MDIPLIEEPETRGDTYPCVAFRWVFRVARDFVGFVHQHRWREAIAAPCGETWGDSHSAVCGVWWHPQPDATWGATHAYYDGTHCAFRVGSVVFQWYNPRCKHCWGEA